MIRHHPTLHPIARARLDRFGRVADQRWTDGAGGDSDRLQYAYDLNSNPTGRVNTLSAGNGEKFTYDALDRLATFDRGTISFSGTLNATVTLTGTASRTQSWTLDALGNWGTLSTNGTTVARTHDAQNRLSAIGSASLTYDANGNQTSAGQAVMTYDAWNRLATWEGPWGSGSENMTATYGYDALGRRPSRVRETKDDVVTERIYLTSLSGQTLIEDEGEGAGEGKNPVRYEYVWSSVYVNAMVYRDEYPGGGQGEVRQRVYAEQDANWNVVATVAGTNDRGEVTWDTARERYASDPYGANALVLSDDFTLKSAGSDFDWSNLFQGGFTDTLSGLVHFGAREYDPATGRWLQQDPARYVDGGNLYLAMHDNPLRWVDPSGLKKQDCGGLKCDCRTGPKWTRFFGGEDLPFGFKGCITFPDGVHCSIPCAEIPGTKGDPYRPDTPGPKSILNHECCHVCDLEKGLGSYIAGAIGEPLGCKQNCDKRAVSATYYFDKPGLPNPGVIVELPL